MRRPSRESAWHPLHVAERAPLVPVTCFSGDALPNVSTQICPPVPFELTVDFQ